MEMWLVRDVMTTEVATVGAEAGYHEIVEQLAKHRISALPVVDRHHHVLGVVSEADLLYRVEGASERHGAFSFDVRQRRVAREKAEAKQAAELMTSPAVTAMPTTPLAAAARRMDQAHVKRLPVVDELGRLVGIVSRADLLKIYLRDDATIREEVVREVLERVLAVEPGMVRVEVHDGTVTLAGRMDRRSAADIAVRLARRVPGVVDVVDRLTADFDDTDLAAMHPRPRPPFGNPFGGV